MFDSVDNVRAEVRTSREPISGLMFTVYTPQQYSTVTSACEMTGCKFSTLEHLDDDGDDATTITVTGTQVQMHRLLELVE